MRLRNKRINQILWGLMVLSLALGGCHPSSRILEPDITYYPTERLIQSLPSPFDPLSEEEMQQDWGKQIYLGIAFAREIDLYRALTCFKSALLLLPGEKTERRLQVEYYIFESYFLGGKYQEALAAFDTGSLLNVSNEFPAFHELLIMLYDCYLKTDQPQKAYRILCLISNEDFEIARHLNLETAICWADFETMKAASMDTPLEESMSELLNDFHIRSKSVQKAQTLNAFFPGAGYFYVGQKKTALTSFLLNALFIAAAYEFFHRGYVAAGVITSGFEAGWYFGGINGAGLAAKEYNQQLYGSLGKEMMMCHRLFPVLMFQKSF